MGLDVTKFSREVERIVRKFGKGRDENDRSDIRNECYLALLQNQSKISGRAENVRAYAYRVCENQAKQLAGRRNREKGLTLESLSEPSVVRKTDKLKHQRPISTDVLDLLAAKNKLPFKEAAIIQLRFLVDPPWPVRQLAKAFDMTDSEMTQKIYLILQKLKSLLET